MGKDIETGNGDGLNASDRREKYNRSSTLNSISKDDADVDESRIRHAVEDTGLHAFGILSVEVWLLNESDGTFMCPEGGTWTDPVLLFYEDSDALKRIIDPNHPNFMPPLPQIAGTGLAGYFWSFVSSSTLSSSGTRLTDGLSWRDLNAISSDPDQPPNPRLQVMVEAGIGKGAGVPFNILGQKGIVIYLARGTADVGMLNELENSHYLQFCANFLGGAASLTRPRHLSIESKRIRMHDCFQRIINKFATIHAFQSSKGEKDDQGPHTAAQDNDTNVDGSYHFTLNLVDMCRRAYRCIKRGVVNFKKAAVKKSVTIVKKSQGSSIQPPPPHPFSSAWLAFVATFVTLSLIYGLAKIFERTTSYTILLGPFSSLMCAQYALTAAPASQPRTILLGQFVSCTVAFLLRWVLVDLAGGPQWLVATFATAVAIFNMAKLGVVHPPAAGAAFLFANGEQHFALFALVFLGQFIAIGAALLFNNWSDKRQYPVYWSFGIDKTYSMIRSRLMFKSDEPLEMEKES